jgi:hypothetical protein
MEEAGPAWKAAQYRDVRALQPSKASGIQEALRK